jgi:hypothetical protein
MKAFLTILFLIGTFAVSGQNYKFEGVIYAEDGKRLSDALVSLLDTQDSVRSNETGYFSFTRSEQKDVLVNISKKGFRIKSLYLAYTKPESRLSRISLCKLCKYDSSNRICPVCKSGDKVLDIVYGLPVPPLRKDVYYDGYCEVTCCDPKYYCLRDKKKF